MSWKGHLKFGVIFLIIATILCYILSKWAGLIRFDLVQVVIGWIFGLYCAILPDIDHKNSKVFSLTIFIFLFLIIFFVLIELWFGVLFIAIFMIGIMLLGHRGITHKWYVSIFIGVVFAVMLSSIIVGIHCGLAYLSHAGIEKTVKGN